jgi:hypothetical protein
MTTGVLHILRPITLWTVHFIGVYALISAICAPRALLETDIARPLAALVTLIAFVVMLVWLLMDMRRLRRIDDEGSERPLIVAACWSAVISGLAIVANLWPLVALGSCTG